MAEQPTPFEPSSAVQSRDPSVHESIGHHSELSEHLSDHQQEDIWNPPSRTKWYIMWVAFSITEIFTSAEKASFNLLGSSINDHFDNYQVLAMGTISYLTAAAVCKPLTGRLTDIFSNRRAMMASNILYVVGCGICAASYFLPRGIGQYMLIFGRVLIGLGSGAISSITNEFKDYFVLEWQPALRWVWTFWGAIGSGGGGVVGGILDSNGWGWQSTFVGQGAVVLIVAAITHFTVCELPESNKKKKKRQQLQDEQAILEEPEHADEPQQTDEQDIPSSTPHPTYPRPFQQVQPRAPQDSATLKQKLLQIDWLGMFLLCAGIILMIAGSNLVASRGIGISLVLVALSVLSFVMFFAWGKMLQKRRRARKAARGGDQIERVPGVQIPSTVHFAFAPGGDGTDQSGGSVGGVGPRDIEQPSTDRSGTWQSDATVYNRRDSEEPLLPGPSRAATGFSGRTLARTDTSISLLPKTFRRVGSSASSLGQAAFRAPFDFWEWFSEVYPDVDPFIKTRLLTDSRAVSLCLVSGLNHLGYWMFKIHMPIFLDMKGLNKTQGGAWLAAPSVGSIVGPLIITIITMCLLRTSKQSERITQGSETPQQTRTRLLRARGERRRIRRNLLLLALFCSGCILVFASGTTVFAQSRFSFKFSILLFAGMTTFYTPMGNLVQQAIRQAAKKPSDRKDTKSLLFAVRSICNALGVIWGSFLYSTVLRSQLEDRFDKTDPGARKRIEDLMTNARLLKSLPEEWKAGATSSFRIAILSVMSAGTAFSLFTVLAQLFALKAIIPDLWRQTRRRSPRRSSTQGLIGSGTDHPQPWPDVDDDERGRSTGRSYGPDATAHLLRRASDRTSRTSQASRTRSSSRIPEDGNYAR